MKLRHTAMIALASMMSMSAMAQGHNTQMGGNDGNYQSLAERVLKLEKKSDAFQVYLNYAASAQMGEAGGDWQSRFANKQLRLEIKGHLTDKLYYRLRHRMNKNNTAQGQDNFAKATDIMMVGYDFSDKLSVQGGKMCQIWGGFEFDENPMYIYQYSDMVDNMDNFMAGAVVSYKPVAGQEIALGISNAYNGTLSDFYGAGASTKANEKTASKMLEAANHPLTYILNWNGTLFDGLVTTRWSWGLQTQTKDHNSQMLVLGQQLNLPKFTWYLDYMGAYDGVDRLKIASAEVGNGKYLTDVQYHSFITKANWQFAPQWNLMLKGMYELTNVSHIEKLKNYRHSYTYLAGVEYYPVKAQDFRVFLTYVGHTVDYKKELNMNKYSSNRIELGFMYRIKAF